jgi:hypothetical protein
MMKRKILFALAAMMMLTAARCHDGEPQDRTFDSPECEDVTGFTVSYFANGHGTMVILPISKVRTDTVFVIALDPLGGFGNADVTVTGTGAGAGWINGSGTYNGLPKGIYPKQGLLEVGCVPDAPIGTEYKFKIEVDEGAVTNTLDPRARVVN